MLNLYSFRLMYTPKSTIYRGTSTSSGATERLTSSSFDQSAASTSKKKEVRPFSRHDPARGFDPVRSLNRSKYKESNYMKR